MGQVIADLLIRVLGDTSDAENKLDGLNSRVNAAAKGMQRAGALMVFLGAGAATALVGVVMAAANFEQGMANVNAVLGLSKDQFAQVSDLARQLGKDTVFSATQATGAIKELGKAGVSIEDILSGAAQGALDLAAAAGTSTDKAATIIANAMNIFQLSGDQATRIADVLAAGSNKSAASVESLGLGMAQSANVAAMFGLSLEDTVGALALFADYGLQGSDAGTSFKTALTSMLAPVGTGASKIAELGLNFRDANGEFIGLAGASDELRRALDPLPLAQRDAALAAIFGSDAIRVGNILYGAGADKINEYTDAVDDQGAAQRVAEARTQTMLGAIERMKGAITDLAIGIGQVLTPYVVTLAGWVERAAEIFSSLPSPVQKVAAVLLVLVAALVPIGTALVVVGTAVPGIIALFGGLATVIGPVIAVLASLWSSISAVILAVKVAIAVLGPWQTALIVLTNPIFLLITAIGLFTVAYRTNFLGFGDLVRSVVGGVIGFIGTLISAFSDLRVKGFDPISAAIGAVARALKSIGGDATPGWIVSLANGLERTARTARLFIEALRKIGGGDAERVHKILNQLPAPLAKIVIMMSRVIAIGKNFLRLWGEAGKLTAFRNLTRDIEMLGRTFANFIQSITGFSRFSDQLKTVFTGIGTVIRGVINLVDDLVNGRWAEAWRDLKNLAKDSIDLFVNQLQLLPLLIADVFDAIPWAAIGSALWNGLKTGLDFLFSTAIPFVAAKAIELFSSIDWGAVANAISDAGGFLITKGVELLTGLYNGALSFLTGTVLPWLAAVGPTALAAIPNLIGTLLQKGIDLLSGLWDGISNYWPTIRDWFGGLPGRIAGLIPDDIGSRLAGNGRAVLRGLRDGILEIWDSVIKPWFGELPGSITSAAGSVADYLTLLYDPGKALIGGLVSGVKEIWDTKIVPFFGVIKTTIEGLIPTDWSWVETAFQPLVDAFQGVYDLISPIWESISGLIDSIVSGWNSIKGLFSGGSSSPDPSDDPTQQPSTGTGTTTAQGMTATFDGSGALEAIQTWATEVMAAIAPVQAFFSVFGGAGVGTTAAKTMYPPVFSGANNLETVTGWVDEVIAQFKRVNLSSAEQMRALDANTLIQFAAIKTTAQTGAFDTKNAVENEFLGMNQGVGTLLLSLMNGVIIPRSRSWVSVSKQAAFDTKNAVENEFVGMRNNIDSITSGIPGIVRTNLSFSLSGEGYTAGSSFGSGAYNGALAWGSALYDAGVALANNVVLGFNSVSKPGSPSRTAIYWASKIPEGVEYALNAGLGDVARAGARLAGAAFGSSSGSYSIASAAGPATMAASAMPNGGGKGGDFIFSGTIIVQGDDNGDFETTGRKILRGMQEEFRRSDTGPKR